MATNGRREKLFENVEGSINGCPYAFHGCGKARIDQPPYVKLDVKKSQWPMKQTTLIRMTFMNQRSCIFTHCKGLEVYGNRPTPFS